MPNKYWMGHLINRIYTVIKARQLIVHYFNLLQYLLRQYEEEKPISKLLFKAYKSPIVNQIHH